MSGIRFEFDPNCLPEIMRSEPVRGALKAEADRIAPIARTIARSEVSDEFADSIHVVEEVRPRGRPTAAVVADSADAAGHEHGTSSTPRRRVLGRAAHTRIDGVT
ncbi:hypothetical protein [Streptomyces brevispora]|uniref:HK97 gp10 family phage protein n=1 Tax=Streptomyces brevispora TaxID=887462 RepID=A0ABZ1G3A0_9ACTN|nr:hypothetical protein [Streptomyces brevispora]WSC14359.1 hypothetical protein OIE64_16915 [Streptomyces brevispora]WSC14904.1 hypothetical protein OIE64_20065 [Streptomyces brevispora]